MNWLLIVTAVYVGGMAPGQANIRIETPNLSARDCGEAEARWKRTLAYLGATQVETSCDPIRKGTGR